MDTSKAPEQRTNTIPLTPVVSSQIAKIGFDGEQNVLAIQFKSEEPDTPGPIYHYFQFPSPQFEALAAAKSIGSFFYANVKGKYDYQRIEPTTGELKLRLRGEQHATFADTLPSA